MSNGSKTFNIEFTSLREGARGRVVRKILFWGLFLLVLLSQASLAGEKILRLATTTSTDNTGLLDYLAPRFFRDTGIRLQWVAVGTGKALRLGANCDVDALLVHAPEAEKKFMASGYGLERREVMYNDFVLVGPPQDPARIKGLSAPQALRRIAQKKALFVSRGDDSGTHKRELSLWQKAGLDPKAFERQGWYWETGQGMLATLRVAAEKGGYTLTDRGTYIRFLANEGERPRLVVLVAGGEELRNQYSVIVVNPSRCPNVKAKYARLFVSWITSPKVQREIGAFRLLGKRLFVPNARP